MPFVDAGMSRGFRASASSCSSAYRARERSPSPDSSPSGGVGDIDPSKLATVERGTMVRSVVATGKVEPITKVEIKSKANGIIQAIRVDVDTIVGEGDVLVELDKELLLAQVRGAEATLLAAKAALEGAEGAAQETPSRPKGPTWHLRGGPTSARSRCSRRTSSHSRPWTTRRAPSKWRRTGRRAAPVPVVRQPGARLGSARTGGAGERRCRPRDEDLANATIRAPIRATVLTRDVEIGSPVSSILNLGANATLVMTLGDIEQVFVRGKVDEADIGNVRLGQQARIRVETFRDKVFTVVSPRSRRWASRRTTSRTSRCASRSTTPEGTQGEYDRQRRDRPRGASRVRSSCRRRPSPTTAEARVPRRRRPGAKTGRRRVPVTLGVGNGTRIRCSRGPGRRQGRLPS